MGADAERLWLCDLHGVLHSERADLNRWTQRFARATEARTLADVSAGADVLVGVSAAGAFTADLVTAMAPRPLVFALANPDPEIMPEVVLRAVPDAIVATGRSDRPNQINNLLAFPFLFRGALDARARRITPAMLIAAVQALASIPRSEEHTSELQSLMRIAYAVFCLKNNTIVLPAHGEGADIVTFDTHTHI